MRAVFLCGFMGCGKTTVGKKLSALLSCDFTDLDEYILKTEGKTIPEIFSQNGESYFRQAEERCLKELSEKTGGVIALGGGAILNPNTAKTANDCGITVFIDVPFEISYERIKDDENRPIAAASTKEQLFELYEKRLSVYKENSQFSVFGTDSEDIAGKIAEIVL